MDARAQSGLYDVVTAGKTTDAISRTSVANLGIIVSDDPGGSLENWILHTPDGHIRLRRTRAGLDYDFILIDTQDAIGTLKDLGVFSCDPLLSPMPPEILSAGEFARGALGMLERLRLMQHLGAPIGHLHGLCYRMDRTIDARLIANTLHKSTFAESRGSISIINTVVPAIVAYREAASAQIPVHEWVPLRTRGTAPAVYETLAAFVRELLPYAAINNRIGGTP